MDWTSGDEFWLAQHYGESIEDAPSDPELEDDMPEEPTADQLARQFSHAVFVTGEPMTLGAFLTYLGDYGDARVREALAAREGVETGR